MFSTHIVMAVATVFFVTDTHTDSHTPTHTPGTNNEKEEEKDAAAFFYGKGASIVRALHIFVLFHDTFHFFLLLPSPHTPPLSIPTPSPH